MISNFYTVTFNVLRLSRTGYISSYGSVGSFSGHLQQSVQLENIPETLRKTVTHAIWCPPDTDVKVSDVVQDDTYQYSVQAIQDNGFVGENTHLELLVQRTELISA